jgi:hypothetical protein
MDESNVIDLLPLIAECVLRRAAEMRVYADRGASRARYTEPGVALTGGCIRDFRGISGASSLFDSDHCDR